MSIFPILPTPHGLHPIVLIAGPVLICADIDAIVIIIAVKGISDRCSSISDCTIPAAARALAPVT